MPFRSLGGTSAPERIRTFDLWYRKPMLYPLSYGGRGVLSGYQQGIRRLASWFDREITESQPIIEGTALPILETPVQFMNTLRARVTAVVVAVAIAIAGSLVGTGSAAQAYSGSDFSPGSIISDALFYNGYSLSAAEIQEFLNAKVPRCTLGDPGRPAGGIYTFPNGSQTLLANNCLKDFSEWIPNLPGDSVCSPITGGTLSAAELIQRIGTACNVSQKVLLVLLEKEQSLISDSFPAQSQMDRATGFNCPDTAPCSAASAGFFRQVYSAARQLQVYGTGSFTWYPVGRVSNIRFHPNVACGNSPVLIQNRATAALYYYTPYQPNNAALNNLYGTGDGCSAYGNRNFWRMYNDWFGSTLEIPGSREFVIAAYSDVLGRTPAESEISYWVGRISSGMSRNTMANAFNNSDEYRINKISEAYNRALRRDPEPAGLSYWLDSLRKGPLSPENVYSTFLTSDEMYNVQGGGTDAGYVTAMYRDLLGREPEVEGLVYWTSRLGRGESRKSISEGIWFSAEKYYVRVSEAYRQLLGRDASLEDQKYWSQVARSMGPTEMRSQIMSSQEYWNRANVRF